MFQLLGMIILGSLALSLVGTVLSLAFGLLELVLGLAIPAAAVAALGYFIYHMYQRGVKSGKANRMPKTEWKNPQSSSSDQEESFPSFFDQNGQGGL